MKFWSDGSEISGEVWMEETVCIGFQDAMNGKSEEYSTIKDLDEGVRLIDEVVVL